jgi:3D (Asp-Asp-Asp) domain-containing protein
VASPADVIRIVYELSVADKGTRQLLASERAVQKETRETSRALGQQDAALRRSATIAEQSARREQRAAQKTAAARKRAANPGLLRRTPGAIRGQVRDVGGLAPGVGVAGAAILARQGIQGASAEAESITKNQRLFGQFASNIEKFADRSGRAFGISRRAALEYTGVFGNLARSQKIGEQGSASLSVRLTKLAADLASFNNTSIEDALEALRSGLVGETEPMRKFGVALSATAVQAEAARLGLVKVDKSSADYQVRVANVEKAQHALNKALRDHGEGTLAAQDAQAKLSKANEQLAATEKGSNVQLTARQKIMATTSLIFRQTAQAQGDFGRTSSGLANQQRILTAQWEDARNELGRQLLPSMTRGVGVLNDFIRGMREGTGQGGRFAEQAKQTASDLKPVGETLRDVGKFLVDHPRLVIAAAGAYASFKAVRGTLRIVNDVRAIGSAIGAVASRAARTRLATILADGARGAGRRVGRALDPVVDVVGRVMDRARLRGAGALGASARWRAAGRVAGRAFGVGILVGMTWELKDQINKGGNTGIGRFFSGKWIGDLFGFKGSPGHALGDLLGTNRPKRRGGLIGMASGGLVPFMAAGGEMLVDGGRASVIPGDPRSDSTLAWARPGAAVITADGQARMALGATVAEAVRSQMPHFAKGGVVGGSYTATAYGPPWGGIQGTGTTATGVNLRRSPHVYGVAVDPRLIPLGSQVYAWPNPFNRSGPFRAFDTGGAIKGHRLDFYDWRGRAAQNRWGSRSVRVSGARVHAVGRGPSSAATEDVTARVPLVLGRSGTRAGLLTDAVSQGIAAGAAGLTRQEIARAQKGVRGARPNPIMDAIRGAMGPTTREVTIPGASGSELAGVGKPSGVSVPRGAWNPAHRPIAKWIVPYLRWAAGHGWGGTVVSGWRSLAEQRRIWASGVRPAAKPGTSNHEGSVFPRGAVDVTQASKLSSVLKRRPGAHPLVWAGAKDPVHFSHPHGGSYRTGGLIRRMQTGGRLGSALSSAMTFKGGSLDALDAVIGSAVAGRLSALRAEVIRRVRKGGDKRTIQRLQSVIDLIDFEMGRRIGRIQDAVERRTAQIERRTQAVERGLRLAGVDPSTPMGVAAMGRAQAAETGVRRQNVASLQRALTQARRTGDREVIRDITDRLHEAQDALAESLVRQVELWRDQLRALGEEAVNQAQFRLGLTQASESILEAWQRTAGVQDTAQSMMQRAQFIGQRTLPALQQQQAAAQFNAQMAAAAGDLNGWRAAVQDAAQAAVDIANAQADAADLLRAAAAKAAQDVVDAAGHGKTMADLGLQRLELEQQLIGTFESTGAAQGRADFITRQIVPAIQQEIAALTGQMQVAQLAGDQALATQIAEAIYSKQNDVMQAQLDAQNAIKDNTDLLKEFGGSLAFSYQGQIQTDLDVIRARAGA